MSYDVKIVKGGDLYAANCPEITLEEWKAAVSHFPDFVHRRLEGADDDDEGVWQIVVGMAAINFFLCLGMVWVSNPKRQALQRMYQLAQVLQAKVIGEEDEVYDEHGFPDRPTEFVPREQ